MTLSPRPALFRFLLLPPLAALFVVVASGCGGVKGRKPTYTVTGTVTLDGKPVKGAAISYSPKQGQPAATGRTDDEGKYRLTTYAAGDGAVEGDYVAMVTEMVENTGPSAQAEGHDAANPDVVDSAGVHKAERKKAKDGGDGGSIPDRYSKSDQSDLNVTVKPENGQVIDLKLMP